MNETNRSETAVDLLADYPFVYTVRMAWGEMDAFAHLNNVVLFRYFESARIAFFEQNGFVRQGRPLAVGPILASTGCRFKIPLTYPDTLQVGLRIKDIKDDRFTIDYAVASEKVAKISATGDAVIVSYDYENNRKTDLTEQWRKALEANLR